MWTKVNRLHCLVCTRRCPTFAIMSAAAMIPRNRRRIWVKCSIAMSRLRRVRGTFQIGIGLVLKYRSLLLAKLLFCSQIARQFSCGTRLYKKYRPVIVTDATRVALASSCANVHVYRPSMTNSQTSCTIYDTRFNCTTHSTYITIQHRPGYI